MDLIQLDKPKLSELVSKRLEKEIISGRFPKGSVLPSERDLMDTFGVGRPAIREAVFLLQQKGLIQTRNGQRATVVEPTADIIMESLSGVVSHMLLSREGAKNLYEARTFLEVGLVREAALNATPADIARLEQILDSNRQAIGDLEEFQRTDMVFHKVLAEIPENPIFPIVRGALYGWLQEQSESTLSKPGQQQVAYDFHARILANIKAEDPAGSERAMREHLAQSYALYKTLHKPQY